MGLKENSSPNFGATIAARKIIAERFHLRVEKSAIGQNKYSFLLKTYRKLGSIYK